MSTMREIPRRFEILVVPQHAEGRDLAHLTEVAIRSAVVEATGETGASGYPRYAGSGMVADIDPETRTVEALLVDGFELDYGLSARVVVPRDEQADRPRAPEPDD